MKKLICIVACLFLVVPCAAAIITVDNNGPADFNNIQAAIDTSVNGDEIVVAPGTYTGNGNRDIDFLGKDVTVRSTDPNDPCVVATTVIDCENMPGHRGFYFQNSEGPNSVLSGFTIKSGRIEENIAVGGGIYCYQSSPTIEYCTITDNTVIRKDSEVSTLSVITPIIPGVTPPPGPITIQPSDPLVLDIWGPNANLPYPGYAIFEPNWPFSGPITIGPSDPIIIDLNLPGEPHIPIAPVIIPSGSSGYAAGGGICIKTNSPISEETISRPTIYKCRIVNNNVDGGDYTGQGSIISTGWTGGGGIACFNSIPEIIDCVISNNTAKGGDGVDTQGGESVRAGGIMGGGAILFVDEGPEIIDCVISNNAVIGGSKGPNSTSSGGSAYAGGVSGPATVTNSIISNNTISAVDGAKAYGGGIYGKSTVINSIISSNTATTAGGGNAYGAGISGPTTVINSLISGNTAYAGDGAGAYGGAVYCSSFDHKITLISSTITQNIAVDGGVIICFSYSTITNCILWDNIGSTVIDATENILNPSSPTISITYNDVEGGRSGTGNIDADPCFVNPDTNDFHLLPSSPCINAGDPNFLPDPYDTDLDGDPRIGGGRIEMGADELAGDCMAQTNPDYNNWVYWNKPDCWCYRRQCRGDTDGVKTGPFWINLYDLMLIRNSINLLEHQIPPGGICADLDHEKLGSFWVSSNDLVILRQYISRLEANVPLCADPPDENYNYWITP